MSDQQLDGFLGFLARRRAEVLLNVDGREVPAQLVLPGLLAVAEAERILREAQR